MVFPAPASDDAPRAHGASWLARLSGILRLVRGGGVLVLVDRAQPARLGELVRSLLPAHPDLEVHTDAVRLARAEHGAVVVLIPAPEQATWLNLERPILAHRALRVILFSDAEGSTALARRAPDFFHWISHRLECPEGPPLPAVRGLRRAFVRRALGVAWSEGDFEVALSAALPGRPLVRLSAALPYARMVDAAKPRGNGWIGWTEVDGPFRLQRVRWAMAEAGRRGRSALLDPAVAAPGFTPVHGRLLGVAEARARLEDAGAKRPGRLAALLDLEPEAVELAAALLRRGEEDTALEKGAAAAGDPGIAMAKMAEKREVAIGAALRARAFGLEAAPRDAVEAGLLGRAAGGQRWVEAAERAIYAGDAEVAVLWAKRGLALLGEDPRALQVAGRALEEHGEYTEAEALSKKAVTIAEEKRQTREAYYVDALADWAGALSFRGKLADAEQLLRKAVATEKRRVGENHPDYATALGYLALVLRNRAKLNEAERLLRRCSAIARRKLPKNHPDHVTILDARGTVLFEGGKYNGAEALFREAMRIAEETVGPEHPSAVNALHDLGRSLLEQEKYADAEALLRRAAGLWTKLRGAGHPKRANSLHELARSLKAQGRYDEAEQHLRESLRINEKSIGSATPAHAASLHEIAGMMLQRGEYAEAARLLRQVVTIEQGLSGTDHPTLCPTLCDLAMALWQQGETEEAEVLARRALEIAKAKRGPRHPDLGQCLYVLARLRAARGDPSAAELARRAHEALSKALGPDATVTRSAAELLRSIAHSS
jgi:tetratricopeptide (TPR) repeat protein